jgi:hypothetical protein
MLYLPSSTRSAENDLADADDGVHRGPQGVIEGLVAGSEHGQRHAAIAGKRVGSQVFVARLEDMQRQQHVGEQHDFRQGEDRRDGRDFRQVPRHLGSRNARLSTGL